MVLMSSPVPPLPVKLTRNKEASKFAGVSAAIADRLGIDPLVVRALFVLASFCGGAGVVSYLSIWALTPSSATDQAPLDSIGKQWRRISGPVYLTVIFAVALFVGCLIHFPLGISPIIVVGLAVLIGSQLDYRPPKPAPLFTPTDYQPAIEQPAAKPKTTGSLARSLLLSGAIVAGSIVGITTDSPAYGAAIALAAIAFSLLILARRGHNLVLIIVGALIAVLALTSAFVQRYWVEEPNLIYADSISQTVIDSQRAVVVVDPPLEQEEITLKIRYSEVTLVMPEDRNVTITVDSDEYSKVLTGMPPQLSYKGNNTWDWQAPAAQESNPLKLTITTESSLLEAGL